MTPVQVATRKFTRGAGFGMLYGASPDTLAKRFMLPSWIPSVVDRLAALAEPDGELAQRIETFDGVEALKANL